MKQSDTKETKETSETNKTNNHCIVLNPKNSYFQKDNF